METKEVGDSGITPSITPSKPPLSAEQGEVNSVAKEILSATPPAQEGKSLDCTPTAPGAESPITDFVAKGIIGNQLGRIEFALVHKIVTMPMKGKHARELEQIDKREAKLDRKQARELLGDVIYFELLNELMELKVVKDEVEYDQALNKLLSNANLYNNMDTLLKGRLEGVQNNRPDVK